MLDEDPRAALIYAEAVRALEQQSGVVESVRGRAGTLLSAASIATAFLAGLAIKENEGLALWSGLATVTFVGILALCIMILWPRREWKFSSSARVLARSYLTDDVTLALAQKDLALWSERWYDANAKKLRWLFAWFEIACALLGLEIAFWLFDLWRG